ncbi:hypothetical protein sos41_35840 [Alphaproteobacteria bacterium SO-S41]|nr:hypothetical protein sos41_35840 [Alphaproteobacteria bacterium SO-S41]
MAPRPQYREDPNTALPTDFKSTVDGNQDAAIANLTRHIQVLWNHVERLEKLLAVGARGAAPAPTTQTFNIYSVGDGSVRTNNLVIETAHKLSLEAATSASFKAQKGMEVQCDGSVRVAAGRRLTITSDDEIAFACGAATLTLKKDGNIVLKGKDVAIDGSGRINLKAAADITMKGAKINQN